MWRVRTTRCFFNCAERRHLSVAGRIAWPGEVVELSVSAVGGARGANERRNKYHRAARIKAFTINSLARERAIWRSVNHSRVECQDVSLFLAPFRHGLREDR